MDFDCFDDPEEDAPAACAMLAPRASEHPHFRQSHWVWPAAAPAYADAYALEPVRARGTGQLAPRAQRTVRTPYAYLSRACRTYRVPCGAPQAGAAPDEPLGHAARQLLRQRADACAASLRKARGDAYSGAAAAALLAACAALERDDASAVRDEVPWSQLASLLDTPQYPLGDPLG